LGNQAAKLPDSPKNQLFFPHWENYQIGEAMIPLDRYEKWSSSLDGYARIYLNEPEYQDYLAIPELERLRQLKALLHKPIAQSSAVNEVFFRARWAEVVDLVHLQRPLTLLEIASGETDIIPQMLARSYPNSCYITANMNKILTGRLRAKTRRLPVEIRVIEEDAIAMDRYLPSQSVDLIAFQHAVNDVMQAILCDQAGIDTIDADWMDTLPSMIRIMQREISENSLETHVKPGWLALLGHLSQVLKKDGLMVMNHYMLQLDLDWGYPPGLWENIIPITRNWLNGLAGFKELSFEGFDPRWWLFIQKI
jgi:hypothetical protein